MNSIILPLTGGVLIGLASCIMLLGLGRITGISGILSNSLFLAKSMNSTWRATFLLGLVYGGLVLKFLEPEFFDYELESNIPLLLIAGVLVGYGTRLGSGCTSGHGVCGLGRKSKRSLVATSIFMTVGILTVYLKGLIA